MVVCEWRLQFLSIYKGDTGLFNPLSPDTVYPVIEAERNAYCLYRAINIRSGKTHFLTLSRVHDLGESQIDFSWIDTLSRFQETSDNVHALHNPDTPAAPPEAFYPLVWFG